MRCPACGHATWFDVVECRRCGWNAPAAAGAPAKPARIGGEAGAGATQQESDLEKQVNDLLERQPTSLTRNLAASAVAVLATFAGGLGLSVLLGLLVGGEREGTLLGLLLFPPVAWFVYPVVAWRPFRWAHVGIATGLVAVTAVGAGVVVGTIREGSLTGNPAIDWLAMCAAAGTIVFNLATVVRNRDIGTLNEKGVA